MSRLMLGLVVACVGPALLHGQTAKTMLVEPPSPLLPPTLGKLTRVADGDPSDGLGALNAPDFDPTERAVLIEDGSSGLHSRSIRRGAKPHPRQGRGPTRRSMGR